MSVDLSEEYQHLVSYTVFYACGSLRFPHRGTITLDGSLSNDVIQQIVADKHLTLCPGCLLDTKCQQAQQITKQLGLKSLVGSQGHVKMAEIVRAEVVFFCLPLFNEIWGRDQRITVLNRPANRQALLWVNYRNARWDQRRLQELIQALKDNSR